MYKRHYKQLVLPTNKRKPFTKFTSRIASALILAGKSKPNPIRGQPTKQTSTEPTWKGEKKPTVPIPINKIRYDEVGHWPKPETDKKHCRLCQNYCRMSCSKCNVCLWLRIVTAIWISTANKTGLWTFYSVIFIWVAL